MHGHVIPLPFGRASNQIKSGQIRRRARSKKQFFIRKSIQTGIWPFGENGRVSSIIKRFTARINKNKLEKTATKFVYEKSYREHTHPLLASFFLTLGDSNFREPDKCKKYHNEIYTSQNNHMNITRFMSEENFLFIQGQVRNSAPGVILKTYPAIIITICILLSVVLILAYEPVIAASCVFN